LVPDHSPTEVEITRAKLKSFKLPVSDQIPADFIQAGGEILGSNIHKLVNSIWNKGKFPDRWKESIIVPIQKKCDKTNCNNYWGDIIAINFSQLLLSRLSSYTDEIIVNHQCGLQCNRSTTDQIFFIYQILENKWEYNETVHQLFRFLESL
jgi:hypothetical protein